MADTLDKVAEETIHSLETRLRRIEFVLSGTSEDPISELFALRNAGRENSVQARLAALEHDLEKLCRESSTVKEMIDLHKNYPEIFKTHHHATSPSSSTLTPSEKLSTVLTAAPSIHATSSQLTSIRDTPIPDPNVSADLIALMPRVNRAEVVQQTQAREIAELRRRSAALLERWYLLGIEGVNECFAEWDERTLEVDKLLSRKLRAAEEE
ncbi:hypothetical protein L873DRAFT_1825368 [Choiromyces venosus 120613-1]|uniref:Nuclear distribution protein RO10 n=1 Tax=Choiromyces venosus 120613-1 TaxID=1336337 RepID=A0A3N4K3S1_9PEZI|nr:hypothetical protein L873DRAFT_1825368 [Choiromyces venosus 120613-1]